MAIDRPKLHRRAFLASLGNALAAAPVPRAGCGVFTAKATQPSAAGARVASGDLLVRPQEISSRNGVLEATLTAAPGAVRLGDMTLPGFLYNKSYLPPLFRARAGDIMRIKLENALPRDQTNLHFHGMGVSPNGNSDNVFIHVEPGEDFRYEVDIPVRDRQGPGLFWYHPHAHGVVTKQMLGGMSGGIVIDGFDAYFPILEDIPERFMFIKHIEHEGEQIVSVNGQLNPVVPMRPGEVQFWRIAHIGATLFIKFSVEGTPLYVLATDGHPLSRPRRSTELFVGPAQRIDAMVIAPQAGEYAVRTIPFQNQAWRTPEPARQIATVISSGPRAAAQARESTIRKQRVARSRWIDEVRKAPIARRRTLGYSRTEDRRTFMIDGRVFDESRIDQTVKLGDTEEWTILNFDQQYHSFHIHQTAFLVTEINGISQNEDSLRDTVSTPPATDRGPSSLKVVIPFTDPVIVGKFVYHCHSVDHEDKGKMGVVEVTA